MITSGQLKYIKKLEEESGIKFKGTTKKDARCYINNTQAKVNPGKHSRNIVYGDLLK